MSTPQRHLETLFCLNDEGRILSTREPGPSRGPLFSLIRGTTGCAWAMRADLPPDLADGLSCLVREEPPLVDLREAPLHADRYISLFGRFFVSGSEAEIEPKLFVGPAFTFPDLVIESADAQFAQIVVVEDEWLLEHNFQGWAPGEIVAGRAPMLAIVEDGLPVSICFCARRSDVAAEAGLETAEAHRGRGYGPRVTAAWARMLRTSGRVPLYSTAWNNHALLAVARKLGLDAYANNWSLSD